VTGATFVAAIVAGIALLILALLFVEALVTWRAAR
jgi:hypothetical protein